MSPTSRRRPLGRISPLALALLALAILFGTTGGAVAGAMVTGAQVKDSSLTGRDIATGSVGGGDITNSSLAGTDVREGSLNAGDLADEARMWGVVESLAIPTETGGEAVASKAFTTPKGFVQITASIDANDDDQRAGAGVLVVMPAIDGRLIEVPHFLEFQGEGGGATTSVTVVVPVTAGSHTVDLVVFEEGAGSVVYSRELSIAYAPAGTSNAPILPGRKLPARIANR